MTARISLRSTAFRCSKMYRSRTLVEHDGDLEGDLHPIINPLAPRIVLINAAVLLNIAAIMPCVGEIEGDSRDIGERDTQLLWVPEFKSENQGTFLHNSDNSAWFVSSAKARSAIVVRTSRTRLKEGWALIDSLTNSLTNLLTKN